MKPQLIKWEMVWDSNPASQVQLQNSYEATCTLYPDGRMNLKSDPEGQLCKSFAGLIELLEEARDVARFYYGDGWGK